jgi:hypothetical protein
MVKFLGWQDGAFCEPLFTQHGLYLLKCVALLYYRMSQWELEILTYVRIQTHHILILIVSLPRTA